MIIIIGGQKIKDEKFVAVFCLNPYLLIFNPSSDANRNTRISLMIGAFSFWNLLFGASSICLFQGRV